MVSFKWLVAAAATTAVATPIVDGRTDCGKYNVLLTGLPPFHPLVAAQGWNTTMVNEALHRDFNAIVAAGYNIRFSFFGPEQPDSVLKNDLEGIRWHMTGVGMGVRAANTENLTALFEDMIDIFRDEAARSTFIFNRSPNTTLEAIRRHYPLKTDCASHPGKDLGFNVYCDICP